MARMPQPIITLVASVMILTGCAVGPAEPSGPAETTGSDQACAAPTIVSPATGDPFHPGEQLELTVENLTALCADNPAIDVDAPTGPEASNTTNEDPVDEFDVVWAQGEVRTVLDVVEPNDGSPFSLAITVPPNAVPGAAFIRISTAEFAVEVEQR